MSKKIPLTQGYVAVVDDEDFVSLSRFRWRVHFSRKGTYAARSLLASEGKKTTRLMHRELMRARWGKTVDHVDGDGLNNCRSNLRVCSMRRNLANRGKYGNARTSCYIGVSWEAKRRRWVARLGNRYLGAFRSEEEAAGVRDRAAHRARGRFARLNYPLAPWHTSLEPAPF